MWRGTATALAPAQSWLLGGPHHPLLLLGLGLLICTTELKALPLLMSEGPPPLPKVSEDNEVKVVLTLDSCALVDSGVRRQTRQAGAQGGARVWSWR